MGSFKSIKQIEVEVEQSRSRMRRRLQIIEQVCQEYGSHDLKNDELFKTICLALKAEDHELSPEDEKRFFRITSQERKDGNRPREHKVQT
jgi:hypothetical protein